AAIVEPIDSKAASNVPEGFVGNNADLIRRVQLNRVHSLLHLFVAASSANCRVAQFQLFCGNVDHGARCADANLTKNGMAPEEPSPVSAAESRACGEVSVSGRAPA